MLGRVLNLLPAVKRLRREIEFWVSVNAEMEQERRTLFQDKVQLSQENQALRRQIQRQQDAAAVEPPGAIRTFLEERNRAIKEAINQPMYGVGEAYLIACRQELDTLRRVSIRRLEALLHRVELSADEIVQKYRRLSLRPRRSREAGVGEDQ